MTQFNFRLEGFGGQAGAFVRCLDFWGEARWTAEVSPSIVSVDDRHLALQSANCLRLLTDEEFDALDPQPSLI
jgi:hypothetical protein